MSFRACSKSGIAALQTPQFYLLVLVCYALCSAAGFASCETRRFPAVNITIERADSGPAPLKVELARSPEERGQGLMRRKRLPDGEGMLFIFERDQVLSFWMKDTLIPLSIAFIASDGRIIEIRDMRPRDESPVKSSRSVRYALEVPQGWFGRAGIRPGDVLLMDF
jgi:uncharacterized membrane protein (UPF0127 family)